MRHALLLCALIAAPFLARADDSPFRYTYADLRYISANADSSHIGNGQGQQLSGSYGFLSNFFGLASVSRFTGDDSTQGTATGHFETISATAGAGAHYNIAPTLDAVGSASYLYTDARGKRGFAGRSLSKSGYQVEAGLRFALLDNLQVSGLYDYVDKCGFCSSSFNVEGEYKFTPHFSAVAKAGFSDNEKDYGFGARYNFF